jgi:hypothetical protein
MARRRVLVRRRIIMGRAQNDIELPSHLFKPHPTAFYFFIFSLLKTFSMNPFQGQYPNMAVRITTTPTHPRIHRKTPEMKKTRMINMTPMINRKIPSPFPTFFTFMAGFSPKKLVLLMEPHGQSPWYLHVLRRNPPKHTLLRTRLRRVIRFAFIVRRHRLWPTASTAIGHACTPKCPAFLHAGVVFCVGG